MSDYLPSKASLIRELEARMTPAAWARLTDIERDTLALIIRGRCRPVIEAAFTEFAELVMRSGPKASPKASTGKETG